MIAGLLAVLRADPVKAAERRETEARAALEHASAELAKHSAELAARELVFNDTGADDAAELVMKTRLHAERASRREAEARAALEHASADLVRAGQGAAIDAATARLERASLEEHEAAAGHDDALHDAMRAAERASRLMARITAARDERASAREELGRARSALVDGSMVEEHDERAALAVVASYEATHARAALPAHAAGVMSKLAADCAARVGLAVDDQRAAATELGSWPMPSAFRLVILERAGYDARGEAARAQSAPRATTRWIALLATGGDSFTFCGFPPAHLSFVMPDDALEALWALPAPEARSALERLNGERAGALPTHRAVPLVGSGGERKPFQLFPRSTGED